MRLRPLARAIVVIASLCCSSLAGAVAQAHSSPYQQVEHAYATTGRISPCRFSATTLEAALRDAPTYDVEYFGDFTDAVQGALDRRAAGACGSGRAGAVFQERGLQGVKLLPPPASVISATGGAMPLPFAIGLVLIGIALLAAVAWVLARLFGYEPGWAAGSRQAWAEEHRLSRSPRPRRRDS